ncbi:MAG: GGDEF domain-containing protein [Lachnospiraceae bacterium]|nr:GGDEF domain-containing protein [Lachnospiraceae bacterium]
MKHSNKFSSKTFLKVFWGIYAFLSICVTLFLVDRLFSKDYSTISQHILLNDSWDVTINDISYHDISLDSFKFEIVNKGDTLTMQRILPAHLDFAEGALRLHINQAAVSMYIDDEMIYEYGHDRIAKNKTVGSGPLFINFPGEYEGKTLKIMLDVSENKAFTQLNTIRIYDWSNVYRVLLTENRLPLFLGCFLTIFGTVTCCITVYALIFSRKFLRILCVSVFSICMGLWTLCYYNVIMIFSIPMYSVCLLEYITLYLAPIPLMIYMGEDVNTLNNKSVKMLYRILLTIQIAATTCTIVLHSLDILHFAATLKYMQTLIVCNLIYFIIIEILNLKASRQFVHRLFLIGMLILSGCIAYDLISYYTSRHQGETVATLKGVSSLGMVIFIFILFVSFYINLTRKMMQETERNFLIKSAYTDELTQIHNRRYCMEYMNKIKADEELNYTVFCFDLNNLKFVNDTYGHAKGDILIRSAAEVIADSFESHGIVARMGGDEFIAIAETTDTAKIASLMEHFREDIHKKNVEIPDLNMSIACGYASCSAMDSNIEKAFHLADNRMYENKKQMKKANQKTILSR